MALYEALAKLRAALQEEPDPELVHLYPLVGIEHVTKGYPECPCWCEPVPDHIDPRIIVHNPSH
jgi:hypothetical protein